MNRRRWVIWVLLALALIVSIPLGVVWRNSAKNREAFDEQLRLARLEGLPTNWREFAAIIKPAGPEENAAPLYRQLRTLTMHFTDVPSIDFHPNANQVAQAQSQVESHREALAVTDRASRLPRCWYDRDWAQGAAVLMPEFATMKGAARLVGLKASFAALRGDQKAALEGVDEMMRISAQCGEEPTAIARLVRESIYAMGMRKLANWAFTHPERPEYVAALRKAVGRMPKPDLDVEARDELYMVLDLVDLSVTPEGRKQLGIREEDVGEGERIFPLFLNRMQAKTRIVKAERMRWAAIHGPQSDLAPKLAEARTELFQGLLAYPTAGTVFEALDGGDDPLVNRKLNWKANQQKYVALCRALETRPIPKSIKVDDLLSPFDGKKLAYRFDGKQIVISVSGQSNPLKTPPDAVLKLRLIPSP